MIRSFNSTLLLALLAVLSGSLHAQADAQDHAHAEPGVAPAAEPEVLYWYDPMYPQQRFEAPGRSPFMDMDLVPRYADAGDDGSSIRIDPSITRNLGMRQVRVERGYLAERIEASATLGYDQRQVTVLQTRSAAWVESVAALAAEDVVRLGDPLVELLVPDWVAAQEEYLALRRLGEPDLLAAAWQRMQLSGMPAEMMQMVRTKGLVQTYWTVRSPVNGVVTELSVRAGMSLPAGSTLARLNGIDKVWLEAAVPEAQAGNLHPGLALEVYLPGWPGEPLRAEIERVLPQADSQSRVVRLRAILDNADGLLLPGMSARVTLASASGEPRLLLPADALIRSGQQDLVMLALGEGRFRPQRVQLGRQSADQVEVLQGLQEGQQVVSAAQFLIDSEASLRGIIARTAESEAESEALHSAEGLVVYHDEEGLMLEHGPFESLGMPGMTMQFVVDPAVDLSRIQPGDAVKVWVREDPDGIPIVRIESREVQP